MPNDHGIAAAGARPTGVHDRAGEGGDDGGLVVDLNFLHAPDSAHDPRRVDPQLPPGDVLDVVVPVGELLPASAPG